MSPSLIMPLRSQSSRRGSVVVIVLWTVAVATIIVSSVQLFGHRQATLGREALERTQARWAARAGMEYMLAVMTLHTEKPFPNDARAMIRDMHYVYSGQTVGADYNIVHHVDGGTYGGPMDEHSKININRSEDRGLLMVIDDMTLDVSDALTDWIDEDDDVSTFGVERDYYLSLEAPYSPRNGPIRTIGELELVAGIWPKHFRGEDWNINNRMDPNEDDGGRSFPPDQADGILEGEWSKVVTVHSVSDGATGSGLPRLRLADAEPAELAERLGITEQQATALQAYGQTPNASLSDLLFTPLSASARPPTSGGAARGGMQTSGTPSTDDDGEDDDRNNANQNTPANASNGSNALTDDQLRAVLAETSVEDPLDRKPGKMNLNSVPERLLRDLFELLDIDEAIADEILYMRSSRAEGIASLVDLKSIPKISQEDLRRITQRFGVISNVFTISSRGRAWGSGLEVEIIAVVDRSTVPVRILEYREQ